MWGIYYLCASLSSQPLWLNDRFFDTIEQIESRGDCNAVSPVGAVGSFQFMPDTWAEVSGGLPLEMARDRPIARAMGRKYFKIIYKTLSKWANRPATMEECVASYNGGMGRLRRNQYKIDQMPNETQKYVDKFLTKFNKGS